jgi:hypothetical protein
MTPLGGFSIAHIAVKREMVCVLKRKPEFGFLKEFLKNFSIERIEKR